MKQWKGRFRSRLHPKALAFSTSLPVDKQLYREDIEGSLAHVAMLAGQKILTKHEAQKIQRGLLAVCKEIESGKFSFDTMKNQGGRFVAEDVHMAIEQRLIDLVGPVGGKLHTARSRNDQIAVDERLYLRRAIENIQKQIRHPSEIIPQKSRTVFGCRHAGIYTSSTGATGSSCSLFSRIYFDDRS